MQTELPDDHIAYTIEEWIGRTGQSRSAIYQALRDGYLKAKKRGRRTIILRQDGLDYLRSLPDYAPAKAA